MCFKKEEWKPDDHPSASYCFVAVGVPVVFLISSGLSDNYLFSGSISGTSTPTLFEYCTDFKKSCFSHTACAVQ